MCDINKYAVTSYNAIHGTNFTTSYITKLNGKGLGIIDINQFTYILTYSFPCTDLSAAGERKGMAKLQNTKSGLLWEVERLFRETKFLPQILLMENVPEVIGTKNIKDFAYWRDFLESLGYRNYIKMLNAKNYAIPQNRNRCFMVSLLGDYYYTFPSKIPLKFRLSNFLEEQVDEKYYLSQHIIQYFYLRRDRKNFAFRPKRPNDIASTITTRADRPTENYIIEKEDNDYLTKLLPAAIPTATPLFIDYNTAYGYYINCRDDFEKIPKKDLARTLIAQAQSNAVIYNGRIRKLTPLECFRLMGFSDEDYYKCVKAGISNTQLYKQAGNSIVVNVLEEIFKMLF